MIATEVDAQRNKYKKRKNKQKRLSNYKGGNRKGGKGVFGRFRPYLWAGGGINAANYFGDLAPVNKAASTDISFTRPGFGLYWGRKFHHSMQFVAAFNYGRYDDCFK